MMVSVTGLVSLGILLIYAFFKAGYDFQSGLLQALSNLSRGILGLFKYPFTLSALSWPLII